MSHLKIHFTTPTCVMMIGASCTGKTMLRHMVLRNTNQNVMVISADDLIQEVSDEMGVPFQDVTGSLDHDVIYTHLVTQLQDAVARNQSVIIDGKNLSKAHRDVFMMHVPSSYCRVCVVAQSGIETLLSRNAQRNEDSEFGYLISEDQIRNEIASLEYPTESEFDKIRVYQN